MRNIIFFKTAVKFAKINFSFCVSKLGNAKSIYATTDATAATAKFYKPTYAKSDAV